MNPAVPRDLATIVHKAVEREPQHRYASAGELAADLLRFLDDQPIRARRMSPPERFLRWPANRTVAALSAAVLFASLTGTVVSTYFSVQAGAGRARASRGEGGSNRRGRRRARRSAVGLAGRTP